VIKTILLNIKTFEPSTNVKINVQCSDKEKMGSTKLLGGYHKVFSWPYEDLHGFDPSLVQHIMKLATHKQELVNSALEAPFRRGLRDFLRAEKKNSAHPEWVSIWKSASRTTDNIITCISLQTFRQAIIRNPFPPLNMEIILQQVAESPLRPLLDSLFGYKRIKEKGENVHKTTFITNCDTMPYKCHLFSLLDIGIAFKKTMHMTLDELVSLHIYLDDLIVRDKGLMITPDFQVISLFQISFVLDINPYIFKYL
jgi:hypothetical protein